MLVVELKEGLGFNVGGVYWEHVIKCWEREHKILELNAMIFERSFENINKNNSFWFKALFYK